MGDTHHVTWPDGNSVLCYCHIGRDHTDAPRAADLPDGTVVAAKHKVSIKDAWRNPLFPWRTTSGSQESNGHTDDALAAGAQVLRYGYDGGES